MLPAPRLGPALRRALPAVLAAALAARGGARLSAAAPPPAALPYSPVLDLADMDRGVDPCVDFYAYACGGWMRNHPIPPDQSSWSVFEKLHSDNLAFLGQVLETAARPGPARDPATVKIGDFYASCMDEAAITRAGAAPLQEQLAAIAAIRSLDDLAAVVARLQVATGASVLFDVGSNQDFKDSSRVIAVIAQGGLGLPDRDYYLKEDPRSVEIRAGTWRSSAARCAASARSRRRPTPRRGRCWPSRPGWPGPRSAASTSAPPRTSTTGGAARSWRRWSPGSTGTGTSRRCGRRRRPARPPASGVSRT